MSRNKTRNSKLEIGMNVEINPQSDRTHKKIVQGVISKILTKANDHPHGILVCLESGETGRVKRVIDGTSNPEKKDSHRAKTNTGSMGSLKGIVAKGESHSVEFKSDALWSSNFSNEDIKKHRPQSKELHAYGQATSKIIIAKTLAGFLNTDGGVLVIGVRENKNNDSDKVIGVEREFSALNDPCADGYRRMIVDLIKDYFPPQIFNHLGNYFVIDFEEIQDQTVCGITVSKSDKRVFVKFKNSDHFFIRTDASTRELVGEEVVDYCENRFK